MNDEGVHQKTEDVEGVHHKTEDDEGVHRETEGTPAGSGNPFPPPEFGLALDPGVRRPKPEILVGGRPVRVLRLRPAGARQVDAWRRGEPIGGSPGARALARRLLDAGVAHPRPPAGAGPAAADVTVVVPVRDRATGLADTLDALGLVPSRGGGPGPVPSRGGGPGPVPDRGGAPGPGGPIVVIDDGSEIPLAVDGDRVSGVTVIRHDTPRGPAAARNTGWRVAATPLVAFVDADCVPAPGWLDRAAPPFRR